MKKRFSDPRKDIYLWGRYCDYFLTSKEETVARQMKDALHKTAAYYGTPIRKTKEMIIARREKLLAKNCPI